MPKNRRNTHKPHSDVEAEGLPVVRPNVAGIDLGSATHWVCAPKAGWAGTRGGRVRGDHARVRKEGGLAAGAERRIGSDGKHGSVLDRAARGIGEVRI